MRPNPSRAFTLIELLVVISIIALLSSVVTASLNAARDKARLATARQFASQAGRVAGDSAVGIWDFDECSGSTAGDRSGFSRNGTLTNMNVATGWSADTPSGTGCSIAFDGGNDYIDVGNAEADALTIAFWFKPTTPITYSKAGDIAMSLNTGGTAQQLIAFGSITNAFADEVITVMSNTGSTGKRSALCSTTHSISAAWHHLTAAWNGIGYDIYLDGVRVNNCATADEERMSSSRVLIGGNNSGSPTGYFGGSMDEVRIFSKELTAFEIWDLYAEAMPKYRFADAE